MTFSASDAAFPEHGGAFPPNCCLRSAVSTDLWPIRRLVLGAMLDPTQLRWQQFWVLEHGQEIIACGQLRRFKGAQELGSVVVQPQWRGQGIGRSLCRFLIQQADQPLYLECLGTKLAAFYQSLGFVPARWETMSPAMQQKFRLSRWAARWLKLPIMLMEYAAEPSDG
jgi:amino-acid N-acetyltransferase